MQRFAGRFCCLFFTGREHAQVPDIPRRKRRGSCQFGGNRGEFSTYIGGYGGSVGAPEAVNGLFVDRLGNVTVAGVTRSANFPVTPGAFQTIFGSQTDGFVTRLSGPGSLLESTFLGGGLSDSISGIASEFHSVPYGTGFTSSLDFPSSSPCKAQTAVRWTRSSSS
jgi:hypothetical protein